MITLIPEAMFAKSKAQDQVWDIITLVVGQGYPRDSVNNIGY